MSYLINGVAQDIPPGTIYGYGGSSDPTGWVVCNGVARTPSDISIYDRLVNMSIGSRSGASYTPPDLRGAVLRGITSGETLGSTKGSDTISVSATNIPSHTHSYSLSNKFPAHRHGYPSHTHDYKHTHSITTQTRYDDYNYKGGDWGVRLARDTAQYLKETENTRVVVADYTGNTGNQNKRLTESTNTSVSIALSTNSVGSTPSFNNIPSSYVVNFIMKL